MRQFLEHNIIKIKNSPVPYFGAHSFCHHLLRRRLTAFKHPTGILQIDLVHVSVCSFVLM